MSSSEDDEVIVLRLVTNYHFVNEKGMPVSFSVLPFWWNFAEKLDGRRPCSFLPTCSSAEGQVFLRGTTADGLQKIYKQVTFWKLGLDNYRPKVSVLSKERKWIALLKPRKSYEDRIRTILVTIQSLHFLKRIPEASEKIFWEHLCEVFGSFEVKPSANDLRDHVSLIRLFAERDAILGKSQMLVMFLEEKLGGRSAMAAKSDLDVKKRFISNDVEVDEALEYAFESEEETGLFDSVCAICDNGGEILCCEGRCLRSFHATRDAGIDTYCVSLGYSRAQVEAMPGFMCKNCQHKQHQCFACGKLGSSDKVAGTEVFRCVSATCGLFYHPTCVTQLLFPENAAEAAQHEKKIATGESFTCPVHKCAVCKQGENKKVKELQFALCRRCPKSYHRKCLPRKIAFKATIDKRIRQRAWDGLLPNRILIYCMKHKIDENLGTPTRDHIIFPEVPKNKKVWNVQTNKVKIVFKKKPVFEQLHKDKPSMKPKQMIEAHSQAQDSYSRGNSGEINVNRVLDHRKTAELPKGSAQSDSCQIFVKETKTSVPAISWAFVGKKFKSSFPVIDCVTEKRIMTLKKEVACSLTIEEIMRKHIVPTTYAYSARHVDKSITLGKVEGSVEAIRTALQKLENNASHEDAKAVCEPDMLRQIIKWKYKLNVYLSPFLHGMRYTSFGRHFTKVDKLGEIADMLQWYVEDGDTIVDFCCGANDFSILMKEKLDLLGKKCSFKNYDLIRPKNDFNFEQRDWMKVHPKELPSGSQLIVGLNPPFGVKAALANKFIDKALTFRPKLLILIIPKETERLDKKDPPYDLIWEDSEKLSGKSFYLPGSVDVYENQMEQWNVKPPPLYLWSHSDWTLKHKEIAERHGHTLNEYAQFSGEEAQRFGPADFPLAERGADDKFEEEDVTPKDDEYRRESNKRYSEYPLDMSPKRKKSNNDEKAFESGEMDESSDMSISPPATPGYQTSCEGRFPWVAVGTLPERVIDQGGFSDSGLEGGGNRANADAYIANNENKGKTHSSVGIGSAGYSILSSNEVDEYSRNPCMDFFDFMGVSSVTDVLPGALNTGGQDDLSFQSRYMTDNSNTTLGQTLSPSTFRLPGLIASSSLSLQSYSPTFKEANHACIGTSAACLPSVSSSYPGKPSFQKGFPYGTMGVGLGPLPPFLQKGDYGWRNN